MQHELSTVASTHQFDPAHFVKYCLSPGAAENFRIHEERGKAFVSTWYVDGLVKSYKENHYYNFLAYLKSIGLVPLKARITNIGFEGDVDKDDTPPLEKFTSFNENTVRLSYKDLANSDIVGSFAFN